jgi:hypothetical protein
MARARDTKRRGGDTGGERSGRAGAPGSTPFEPVPPAEKATVAKNRALEAPEDFSRRRGADATPTRSSGRRASGARGRGGSPR